MSEAVRPMTPADADSVAELHVAALPGLLTQLGRPTVRAFYRAAVSLPETLAVALDSGAGFCFGAIAADGYYRRVLRAAPLALGGAMAGAILRRPRLLADLRGGRPAGGAELLFLAVRDDRRGRGDGRRLVAAFEAALALCGVHAWELTVNADNAAAVGFYEALGLRRVESFVEFGFERCRFRRDAA